MRPRLNSAFGAVALAGVLVCPSAFAAEPVKLTPAQERSMGLRVATAVAASEAPITSVSAMTAPPPNGRVVAAAPFAGTVVRVDALEGQAVRPGQTLAVIFSQDALRAGSELAQAEAELAAAQAAAERAEVLTKEGIVAGARADEARMRLAQARAAAAEKRRLVSSAGGRGNGEYALRAPIAGHISQMNLQPGGGVEAMAAAAVIDKSDRLWAEARLPAAFVGRVAVGAPVTAGGLRGRVVAVGSAIDPRTRSVVLRAELPAGAALTAGRTVWLTVHGAAPAGSVALPRSAVIKAGGADTVFVRETSGFRAQAVKLAGASQTQVVVTGVRPGASVVTAGVSQLKSAAGL